jgi:hypothetical protein
MMPGVPSRTRLRRTPAFGSTYRLMGCTASTRSGSMPHTTPACGRGGPRVRVEETSTSCRMNGATPATSGTVAMESSRAPTCSNPAGRLVTTETIGMFSTKVRRISAWKPFITARVMFNTITPMAMPTMAVTLPRLRKRLCRRLRR